MSTRRPSIVLSLADPAQTALAACHAEAADRHDSVPIAGYITCSVHEDVEVARRNAKAVIAFNSTVKTYDGIFRHHGFGPEATAVRAAWASRNWDQMIDAVSERMLDTIPSPAPPNKPARNTSSVSPACMTGRCCGPRHSPASTARWP